MPTLTQVAEEHGARLREHVDRLPTLADEIGHTPWAELRPRLVAEHDFLEHAAPVEL